MRTLTYFVALYMAEISVEDKARKNEIFFSTVALDIYIHF